MTEAERAKLLGERDKLEAKIKALRTAPISNSNAARQGRQEDLLKIARKMVLIDQKLGRSVV